MKRILMKSGAFLAGCLALLAFAAPVHAENLLRVDVPFSFLAADRQMPAGEYWLRFDAASHILDLRPVNRVGIWRMRMKEGAESRPHASPGTGVVTFDVYGTERVLRGVYFWGGDAHDTYKSKREIELARTRLTSRGVALITTEPMSK